MNERLQFQWAYLLCSRSVNNAAAVGGLRLITRIAYAVVGLAALKEALSRNTGKLRKALNSLQDPPPRVEQKECN